MKKSLIFKIMIVFGIGVLLAEILLLDFDNLKASLTVRNIIGMLVPFLIIINMLIFKKKFLEES